MSIQEKYQFPIRDTKCNGAAHPVDIKHYDPIEVGLREYVEFRFFHKILKPIQNAAAWFNDINRDLFKTLSIPAWETATPRQMRKRLL